MNTTRLAAAVVVLAGLASFGARTGAQSSAPASPPAAAGQDGTQGAQQPPTPESTFRAGIDFIRVDAFVSDRSGKPITDLTQADFEVTEDGKPQKVEQFKVIRIDRTLEPGDERLQPIRSQIDEEVEARRDDVRMFVFFLDDYHVRDRNAIGVRQQLTRFVQTQLTPSDMVAIMYPLTPVDDVLFTRDHEKIVNALQRFEGRKYDYVPRNEAERRIERESTDTIEKVRNQIVYSAIEGLSMRLGGLRDSRKSVIFVSEGFTVMLPAQMRRQNAQAPQVPGTVGNAQVEEKAMFDAQAELDSRMRDVYRTANRNNTAFYSLDPRGLAVFEFDISDSPAGSAIIDQGTDARSLRASQDTLRSLSTETGGRAILNRNTLAEGLAEMMQDSSFYYLLGYNTQAPADGKFHDIRVRVKRNGANVRARKGYWAYTEADIKRFTAPKAPEPVKPVQQALATISPQMQAARFVRTWVGTERGDAGKTRVTLIWEPLPASPDRREQAGRVSLTAVDKQGALLYRGRSEPSAPATAAGTGSLTQGGAAAASGGTAAPAYAPQRITFEAPPGDIEMRLEIDGAGGGRLDDETKTLKVPDLTGAQAQLSTPRVFRTRNAREFQSVSGDAAAVPSAGREFSRTERLLIRFDLYVPGADTAVPTAVLLNRAGQKVADLTVAAAKAGGTHQVDIGLNTVAAGEYLVEISAKDGTGAEAKELVPFRVGA